MEAWDGACCEPLVISHQLKLLLLPGRYAICRFPANSFPPPSWAMRGDFLSITRTPDELSGVCEEQSVPADVPAERGRRLMRVVGPLDFSLTGVLASLAVPLAEAKVSIFVISTYNTDYLLVSESDAEKAISALEQAGHSIHRSAIT
ncbi:MAG: hypothetical protein AUG07_00850 [Acidobacteria bacterium 13_1_20CM_2_60_10]|nr:MAG: hypothetical protein AUG07_00850 [Acidobacteria bacterium 13_1_20CM_2_60_10]